MPVFLGLETHHGLRRMTPAHQKSSPPKAARAQYSARWHCVIARLRAQGSLIVHLLLSRASHYAENVVACFTLGMLYNHADESSRA